MNDKQSDKQSDKQGDKTKNKLTNSNPDIAVLIERKITFFQDTIQRTILHVQNNKMLNIINVSEMNNCINILFDLSKILNEITSLSNEILTNTDSVINKLQNINNELSTLFKMVGTELFEDFLWICFGNNSVNTYAISDMDRNKFELLRKYFHPTSYRLIVPGKKSEQNKQASSDDNLLTEASKNLDSVDISIKNKSFHLKVYGIQVVVHNPQHKKSLVISGVVDDVIIDILNNKFVNLKMKAIRENVPNTQEFKGETFNRYISALSLKDFLIYEPHEVYSKYAGHLSNLNSIKQKPIGQIVKEFVTSDLFMKRLTIIQLLVRSDKYDNQYLAYLLYDLLSNDANGSVDTHEQITLFDSLPWSIKQCFKNAMKNTVQYTNELANFDIQKIPLEQQICLLKAPDSVKEKAMQKLKEVKAKSEDSGSKARQFLDGLLKIPFSIYRKEPILNTMDTIRGQFMELVHSPELNTNTNTNNSNQDLIKKESYTSLEILKHLNKLKSGNTNTNTSFNSKSNLSSVKQIIDNCDKNGLITYIMKINETIVKNKINIPSLKHSNKKKSEMISQINEFVDLCSNTNANANANANANSKVLQDIFNINTNCSLSHYPSYSISQIAKIENKYGEINTYMSSIKTTLDNAVHGHDNAKKQIERIIGQWINGQQDGYCFGFEGAPGIGKTSLAKKGLSDCLKDEHGVPRPFAMIQMGGDSNGSSIHGHNYTYVGSTWGSIVQILMDKKCMNPIIFIDEIDKISKTEHGKEIVGILTHLLDPAQNDCFQDKYFSGIDLDLSKALFILSYNDVDAIDRILLDRVHRIKFNNLSTDDKLTICNKHILPEVYKKMGLDGMIHMSNETLKHIIENYTAESGVRKLKEILFEIVGEINLDILKNFDTKYEIPINITIDSIKTKYFKDKHELKIQKIHNENKVGVINGLWANALGMGGIIPIQAKWRPSDKSLSLHLTGTQGDVMKESMNVALTLAYSLTPKEIQQTIQNGLHIHCPDGSTPKDGPSAGAAITTTIYSLFNNLKIKRNIAITGEITLTGNITAIGGLDLKILGGIKAGVNTFLFPKENEKDFNKFMEKYKDDELTKDIVFISVEDIHDVLSMVFE
jgi:ATP-dependent Lon protease